MSLVVLEVLEADDWGRWRAMRLAALADAPDAFNAQYADWVDAPKERFRERFAAVPFNVVAVYGSEDVGMAAATRPNAGGVSRLRSLWVAPAHRGGGVSEALVESVAGWARSQGATTLSLGVRLGNLRAVALYERLGFVDAGLRLNKTGPSEKTMTLRLG